MQELTGILFIVLFFGAFGFFIYHNHIKKKNFFRELRIFSEENNLQLNSNPTGDLLYGITSNDEGNIWKIENYHIGGKNSSSEISTSVTYLQFECEDLNSENILVISGDKIDKLPDFAGIGGFMGMIIEKLVGSEISPYMTELKLKNTGSYKLFRDNFSVLADDKTALNDLIDEKLQVLISHWKGNKNFTIILTKNLLRIKVPSKYKIEDVKSIYEIGTELLRKK